MLNDNVIWRKKSGSDLVNVEKTSHTIAEDCSSVDCCTLSDALHYIKSTDTVRDSHYDDIVEARKFKNVDLSGVESDFLPSYGCSSSSNVNERFFKNATMNATSMFACTQLACSQMICNPLRQMVSQNRRRYLADGFNLDLTYITDRIIAMGYPANATESIYRNSMANTVKFLEHYHPGHYKIFNLRGQYIYDTSKFHNRVISFEMTDHHPPRLELMAPFCREVHEYLCADSRNIVAVHCKAGKGRTGVMICAYLCYISFYNTPRQNMDYYSIIRTHNNKGVTIPSQRRYVYYFSHLREKKLNYLPLRVELVGIYLERPPKLVGKLSKLSKGALRICVTNGDVDVFESDDLWLSNDQIEKEDELHRLYPVSIDDENYNPNCVEQTIRNCVSRRCYGWTVPSTKRVFLEGDVRISLIQNYHLKFINMNRQSKKIGHIWFNTMFTCPGFSGGKYIHGDEMYQISNNEIVHRINKLPKKSKESSKMTDVSRYKRRRSVRSNRLVLDKSNINSETSKRKMSGVSYCSAPLAVFGDKPTHLRNPFTKYVCIQCGRPKRRSMLAVPANGQETRRVDSKPNYFKFEKVDTKQLLGTAIERAQTSLRSVPLKVNLQLSNDEAEDSHSRSSSLSNSSSDSLPSDSFSDSSDSSTSNVGSPNKYNNPSRTNDDGMMKVLPICRSCTKTSIEYQSSITSLLKRFSKQGSAQNFIEHPTAHRNAKYLSNKESNEDIVVDKPPGLEAHCPEESLRQIYPHVRQAPRYGIVEMLRDACRRDLKPKQKPLRASPPNGPIVPRASVGRPNAESEPRCLLRRSNEHVSFYNVNEIDKAHKSRHINPKFKMFIITKCLDESNSFDFRLANSFIDATYNSQIEKDQKQKKKMELKYKKMYRNQEHQPDLSNDRRNRLNDATQQLNFRDSTSTTDSVSSTTTASTSSTSSAYTTDGGSSASNKSDLRNYDPRLHKYFFRQRITSKSRHPNVHYHCPLQKINRTICEKYGCESIATPRLIVYTDMTDNRTNDRASGTRHSSLRSENSVESPNNTLININFANETTRKKLMNPSTTTVVHLNPNKTITNVKSQDVNNCNTSSEDNKSSTNDSYFIKDDVVSTAYVELTTIEENIVFDEFDFVPQNTTLAASHSQLAEKKNVQ